jgi:hypothetical protein
VAFIFTSSMVSPSEEGDLLDLGDFGFMRSLNLKPKRRREINAFVRSLV